MKTIPKLDPILFSVDNFVGSLCLALDAYSKGFTVPFVYDHAIGYALDSAGDLKIMFEFDGELFWSSFYRSEFERRTSIRLD